MEKKGRGENDENTVLEIKEMKRKYCWKIPRTIWKYLLWKGEQNTGKYCIDIEGKEIKKILLE